VQGPERRQERRAFLSYTVPGRLGGAGPMANPAFKIGDTVLAKLPEGEVVVARVLKVNTGVPHTYLVTYSHGTVMALLPESDIIRLVY